VGNPGLAGGHARELQAAHQSSHHEAVVGILIFRGGRPAQAGLVCAIAFHVALARFFSWFLTGYAAVMLVALALLLRTEFRPPSQPKARHRLRHGLT
jgi:hypothetical protein